MSDYIRRHIRQYLDTHSLSISALEKAANLSDGNLSKILNTQQMMSPRTFNKLAPIVNWTHVCRAECEENWQWIQRKRRAGINQIEPARVPWPVTRDHAKAGKHLYATVRML